MSAEFLNSETIEVETVDRFIELTRRFVDDSAEVVPIRRRDGGSRAKLDQTDNSDDLI